MSTHALTCFRSREYDGYNIVEVGHFWRKFDGDPSTHGADLKRLVGKKTFQTLWELMSVVSRLEEKVEGKNCNWMFLPVDPHIMDIDAQWKYYLSLVDEHGDMPRGGACRGECDVHLVVKRDERTIYAGLLRRYIPDDDADEIDEEMDAEDFESEGLPPPKRVSRKAPPGRLAYDERSLIICRLCDYLSRDGRVPCLVKGREEIRGKEPVLSTLYSMPDKELLDLDKGMKSCFGNDYSSP